MRTDIILEGTDYATADFPTSNNTPIDFSDMQHIGDAFLFEKGDLKETPTFGIGIDKYLKASGNQLLYLRQSVKNELAKMGYSSDSQVYNLTNNKLTINYSKITTNV